MFSILLMSCNETNHAVVKADDELSSNIKLLIEKYVDNDFDVSDFYTDDVTTRINNLEFTGYENLMQGFQAHHDVLYDNITIEDLYVHTNYFTSGDIWSNAWFTWKGTGKQPVRNTLIEVTLIINGKMVRLQSYRPITVNMPSKMKLPYAATQN